MYYCNDFALCCREYNSADTETEQSNEDEDERVSCSGCYVKTNVLIGQ